MNDKSAFFALLNLEYKGLEKVKINLLQGLFEAASEELLTYYRNRKGINYYDGWERPALNPDYNTKEADEVCNNHIVHIDLPEDIDWHANPRNDPEWTYCLNRHEYLTSLGRAYWYTGNEKYTLAFKRILTHWIRNNPMPDMEWMLNVDSETSRMHFMKAATWRPLTLGIRMYTSFVPNFYHFLNSPNFTPDFLITMLTSMYEHAKHTRLYFTRHKSYFNVSPNWGIMESNGLAHMGILFPEFKESNDWRVEAMSRFEEQIRMQVLPDGMQVERASGYNLVCTFCFMQILDLALRNKVRVSDTYTKNAEKMIDFVMSIMKPHGVYPMLKDADESDVFGERASYGLYEDINNLNMLEDANDLRWVLKTGARLFNRPDFLYIATHGGKGIKPVMKSVASPNAGFFTMRTGWGNDDLYLVYTCGELGAMDQSCVHGNADALSIDVSGYGETLLIDPGRYIYEGPWRVAFKNTKAHNTIAVDNQDSSELADGWMFRTKAKSVQHCWSTTDKFDYVDGSHEGYLRLNDPVTHRRKICFVKPDFWLILDELTANANHTYDQYFHFGADAEISNRENLEVFAKYKNGSGIVIKPVNTDNLKIDHYKGTMDPLSYVSYDYAIKVPAPVVKYSKLDKTTHFATLLVPFKNKPADCGIEAISKNEYKVHFEKQNYLIIFSDGTERTFGDVQFDGEMLCTQFDAKNNLVNCYGAKTSKITYKGKIILDSVIRHKIDIASNVK